MFGLNISFGFDELPADGVCSVCKLPIEGVMFVPYLQMGEADSVKHFEPMCSDCYRDKVEED